MGSNYLAKGERTYFLVGLGAHEVLKKWANDPKNHLEKEEQKYMRMAASLISKASKLMLERLEFDYVKRLMSDAKNNTLVIMPTRATTLEDESRVKTDTLYNLSNFALLHCQAREECFMKDCSWKDCELYKALMELDVPVANFDGGRCPYKL